MRDAATAALLRQQGRNQKKKFATIAAMAVAVAGPLAGCATTPKAEPTPAVKRDIATEAIIHIRGVT